MNHFSNSICSYSKVMNEEVCEKYLIDNVERLISEREIEIKAINEKRQSAKKKINVNDYRKELDRLNNMYQKGRISEEKYDSEYSRILDLLKEHEDNVLNFPTTQKSFDKIKQTLSGDWLSIYQSLDRENKRAFWRNIIESIECNTDSGTIKKVNFLT